MTTPFKRGYKKKTAELRAKVDEFLQVSVSSKNPNALGRPKHGSLQKCFGYDIDSSNRILYFVDGKKGEIYFLRVCNHTEVYGTSSR